jgi:putative FmdB family regulatory protein
VPIYDYLCSNCRHLTEVVHGIHDPGPRFCPACGADGTMRKALSTPAIHFKGSGWAKKDRSSTSGVRTKAAASSGDGGSTEGPSKDKDAGKSEPARSSSDSSSASED